VAERLCAIIAHMAGLELAIASRSEIHTCSGGVGLTGAVGREGVRKGVSEVDAVCIEHGMACVLGIGPWIHVL
jgi:hypothetical protein